MDVQMDHKNLPSAASAGGRQPLYRPTWPAFLSSVPKMGLLS